MRISSIRLSTIIFFLAGICLSVGDDRSMAFGASRKARNKKDAVQPVALMPSDQGIPTRLLFEPGEELRYQVNYKGLPLGTSVLTFHGEALWQEQKTYHITFTTALPLVKDREDIYAEKETFLPLLVVRSVNKVGAFPEKIEEVYDQKKYSVVVSKKGAILSKRFVIQKESAIHNAILLAYAYRQRPDLEASPAHAVMLPTAHFSVLYKGKEVVKTPLGEFPAHVFTSNPPKFKLWISADEKRIPLKIENPATLGYSLEIKSIDYLADDTLREQ